MKKIVIFGQPNKRTQVATQKRNITKDLKNTTISVFTHMKNKTKEIMKRIRQRIKTSGVRSIVLASSEFP